MLLKELDYINRNLVEQLNPLFDMQFSYGTGTIEQMQSYLTGSKSSLPLIWWVRNDNTQIKTGVIQKGSNLQISTINATYILWLKENIDVSNEEYNNNDWRLDDIVGRFIHKFNTTKPSKGTINLLGTTQSQKVRQTTLGLQGKGFSINFSSPDNIDFCVEC